ncbi:hypothetical protein C8J42_101946 [Sphingomonas sp. PP-CE-1A-559]|uniref:hypothetical protein n=1 Tax=Sphingomonas sp. PP-CE-1A-559 TaxID=2135657 RepID=UPI0010544100|nr:hypothetical protein [Sphingomonas sp. PP-CE-1A-559]TCP94480.1 hypothetical protein C8J42_101946 [Sphingomonas sp. PP-CE-1A-559]
MAIIKTLELRNGLVAKNAYVRVDAFYGSKASISFSANTYLSREAFTGTDTLPAQPFLEQDMLEFTPDPGPDALPIWVQCYAHLKAQDRFADAADDIAIVQDGENE